MAEEHALIASVTEGMDVVDSDGEAVGSVVLVKMSDPDGLADPDAHDGEPAVEPEEVTPLIRSGYIKIAHTDLLGSDKYASADEIGDLNNDTVILTVPTSQLVVAS
ncbi:hypothetical protein [Catelliglobosispora koreensis]|uniref:hypothetical protein n=1 Tax=Catelliglobosispora koreensis TaxID=129052 RepID=UPI0003676A70|nr:hypothetical protein [Catelliglobosispora koreensis]